MQRVMILGAGAAQIPLIRTAKAMGYETVVATIPGPYPGIGEADIVSYTDITDCEAIAAAAEEYGVCAVSTCCLETGLKALAYACEKLGLPGVTRDAAEISVNKLVMKQVFQEKNVLSAKFHLLKTHEELDRAIEEIGLPIVVKAVDLQGSKGVYVVNTAQEAHEALTMCLNLTKEPYCLAEEFIAGRSFCAEAFVQNGHIFFVLPDGNITISNPGRPNIPIGHYAPFDCTPEEYDRICAEVRNAIVACGLDNCAVNMDLVLRDGEPYIIELTARAGATCLSELISIYFGVDYYRMILMASLGQDVRPLFEARRPGFQPTAASMIASRKTGVIRSVKMPENLPDSIFDLHLIVGEGDTIRSFSDAGDRIGQIIAYGDSVPACMELIDSTLAQLQIEVEE